MEEHGIGNIIFYIILAIIGLAGSMKGKKKEPGGVVRRKPAAARPASGQTVASQPPAATESKPVFTWTTASEEGSFDEPWAGAFSDEGDMEDTLAETFSREGKLDDPLAGRFAGEGNLINAMADRFASEGRSSMSETQLKAAADNFIADGEISDAPEHDYDNHGTGSGRETGFDLRKAVIYSSLLERREYQV